MNNLTSNSLGEGTADSESLTIDQAIKNLTDPELGKRYYAAWWLGRFRVNDSRAIDALLVALGDDSDRTEDGGYPLRRNAARALGKLGDQRAVLPLIECLKSPDYYVREAAAQSLGMLGDRSAIPALMTLLEGGVEVAVQVEGKPYLLQPYDSIIEALGSLNAVESQDLITPFLDHFMEKVRFSAARAMYQLTGDNLYGDKLVQALNAKDLQLRRSALMDLGAIGYLPAASAIAATLAENSIKLISLKGVLESHLQKHISPEDQQGLILTEDAIKIMSLMDSLL